MNLDKVPADEKLKICQRYFIVGCFGLPLVWLINGLWFFKDGFIKSDSSNPGSTIKIRLYIMASFIGVFAWIAVLSIWTAVYQTQRSHWGYAGIAISFVLPPGIE